MKICFLQIFLFSIGILISNQVSAEIIPSVDLEASKSCGHSRIPLSKEIKSHAIGAFQLQTSEWLLKLTRFGQEHCQATLITESLVLTEANCLPNSVQNNTGNWTTFEEEDRETFKLTGSIDEVLLIGEVAIYTQEQIENSGQDTNQIYTQERIENSGQDINRNYDVALLKLVNKTKRIPSCMGVYQNKSSLDDYECFIPTGHGLTPVKPDKSKDFLHILADFFLNVGYWFAEVWGHMFDFATTKPKPTNSTPALTTTTPLPTTTTPTPTTPRPKPTTTTQNLTTMKPEHHQEPVSVVDIEICQEKFKDLSIDDRQICVTGKQRDICTGHGTSGGGLFCRRKNTNEPWFLFGVRSDKSTNCTESAHQYAIYDALSISVTEWVEELMGMKLDD